MTTLDCIINAIEARQAVANKTSLQTNIKIDGVASLVAAQPNQLAFLAQAKYLGELEHTKAGVVLVSDKFANVLKAPTATQIVLVKDAYLAYACVSTLFTPAVLATVHPSAVIDSSATLGQAVSVGAYAVIGAGAVIGDGVHIGAGAVIGDGVHIGAGSDIAAMVHIGADCHIGEQVRIHSHASIGSEGFGFAPFAGDGGVRWQRIAQLGRVVIGNRVRIGSNTCIDRGAVDDTIIADDVIIDNLVQIAHNVHIGQGTAIAAKVGIAGSTKIGKNCIIGGAVGINGHLSIADNVTLTGMSMVISDITESGTYSSGTVAMPQANWRRAAVKFRKLGEK
ncbi:UDP-3-O-(3-hydroxymyristoyl)glucosamine N-acyltransferase [Moraxella cuniculi]|uniref:UDP-3-O-acylglucosamine N-acyltransferase n=1 Tax=Moraxella cuniculi TaxID=34061 RepID=A0A3S4RKZ4_9GAMM|nr:UDP-3-O-(3-hydroxymyristoyl)glucosamine N-acyltransferase [Moraxella cuniculi]VEG13134.1 UDP-3-O-acylglucosamine N-acyltransferase [Moraxella cuniculi]